MAINYAADSIKQPDGKVIYLNHYKTNEIMGGSYMCVILPGILSNGSETMTFTLALPKNASGLTPKITLLRGNIRGIDGGGYYYGETSSEMTWTSNGNDFTSRVSDCELELDGAYLLFQIEPTKGQWKTSNGASTVPTNNTPVMFELNSITVEFT